MSGSTGVFTSVLIGRIASQCQRVVDERSSAESGRVFLEGCVRAAACAPLPLKI